MSLSRSGPHRRSRPSGTARGGFSLSDDPDDSAASRQQQPAIWAEGRQAPAFAPRIFAEAGLLLAREDAAAGLSGLASWSRGRADRLRTRDWRMGARLGRIGRLLPSAPGTARALSAFARQTETARHLLYGSAAARTPRRQDTVAGPGRLSAEAARQLALQGAEEAARASRKPPPPDPEPRPVRERPLPEDDPEIAAIRALLRAAPTEPQMSKPAEPKTADHRPAYSPAHWESPPEAAPAGAIPGSPVLRRVMDWGIVRVLAGSALVFATPLGYGRALYRHLDGADLREIVADCHRQRIN